MSRPPAWLLAHVHPLVKKLSTELVAILWARLEQQLGDVTRSALASELAAAVVARAGVEVVGADDRQADTAVSLPAVVRKRSSSPTRRRAGPQSTPPQGFMTVEPVAAVEPEVAALAPNHRASFVRCGKCGASGHNARSCGRAPKGPGRPAPIAAALDVEPVDQVEAVEDAEDETVETKSSPSVDRFARIELVAAKRRLAERDEQQAREDKARARRATPRHRALPNPEDDEQSNEPATIDISGALPEPRATFHFDTGRGRD